MSFILSLTKQPIFCDSTSGLIPRKMTSEPVVASRNVGFVLRLPDSLRADTPTLPDKSIFALIFWREKKGLARLQIVLAVKQSLERNLYVGGVDRSARFKNNYQQAVQ